MISTRDQRVGLAHLPLASAPMYAAFDAVLVDRDGTLNALRPGYRRVGDFEMLEGAADVVARVNATGVPVVLVTNQRGLATGALSWDEFDAVQALLVEELARRGAHLDDVRVCPHELGTCGCRKPMPGLLEAVLADNPHLRRERCILVGDAESDAEAAAAAGMRFLGVDARIGLAQAPDRAFVTEE